MCTKMKLNGATIEFVSNPELYNIKKNIHMYATVVHDSYLSLIVNSYTCFTA